MAVSPDRCLVVSSSHQAGKYMPVEVTLGPSQSIWIPIVAPCLYKGSWLSSKYFKYISLIFAIFLEFPRGLWEKREKFVRFPKRRVNRELNDIR